MSQKNQKQAAVISFLSQKGGSGTTFLAVNTAVNLASFSKVLFVDTSADNSSVMLSMSGTNFLSKIKGKISPDNFTTELIPKHKSGLSCIEIHGSRQKETKPIVEQLKKSYDYIICDAGSGRNREELLEMTDHAVMVIQDDVISIKGAIRKLEELTSKYFGKNRIMAVLNHTSSTAKTEPIAVEKILSIEIDAEIPYYEKVRESINKGIPLVLEDFSFKKELEKISGIIKDLSDGKKTESEVKAAGHTEESEEKVKQLAHEHLARSLKDTKMDVYTSASGMSNLELQTAVQETLEKIFAQDLVKLKNKDNKERLIKEIMQEALGLGPLEDLLNDSSITEIMVNGADKIYVEREGKLTLTDRKFLSDRQVMACIERIVAPIGRRIDESVPLVDARLPDGSRVNAVIPPLSLKGPSLTIRKFSKERIMIDDLIRFNSLTKDAAVFLEACVKGRRNMVISGGTGSGKTTLLNVLSSFIPENERIVTIEDSAELNLPQEHVLTLETRPPNIEGNGAVTIRDLVRNSLRMRPDRIVVGECRGGEALDMLQAMNTGHDGSLTTLHSNSPRDTLSRLETMVLMSGMDLPLRAIREQIASAVNVIIHQSRFKDGSRKITHITEVDGMEGDIIQSQDIFVLGNDGLEPTGIIPSFLENQNKDSKFDLSIFAQKFR